MKKFTALVLMAAIVLGTFAMTACEDSGDKTESAQEATESLVSSEDESDESNETISDISVVESKPEITNEQLSSINDFIAQYKDIPEFTVKAKEIDATGISKNENVSLIPDNSNNVFTSLVVKQFKSAAKSAGFKKIFADDSDGTPAAYNDALAKAVEKSDIVVMYGDINKDPIANEIELTQANGVKVLSAGYVGKDMKDHYVDYTIPIDYQLAGKLLADWAISKNKGKVNALAINNSDSTLSTSIYNGFADEFTKYVTSGYCTVQSGSSIEVENGLATKIKQALEKDPNLNYIIVLDETMINDAISAVDQLGRNIKIIATGGGTSAFTSAENGKIEMLVAQSYEWTAYAMVDYALRVLDKSELPEQQSVPVRVITQDSIKSDLESTEYDDIDGFYEICFGANFVTGYRSLWGLD